MIEELNREKLEFVKLSDDNVKDLTNFSCYNESEKFEGFNSKQRKKFKKYSIEIDYFLKTEALTEQNQGLNTTHLLYHKEKLIGFISLCTDSLKLSSKEKEAVNVPYMNIPALKIARLAIHKDYQHLGLGKMLIKFAVSKTIELRKHVGIKLLTVDCYKHRITYYENNRFTQNEIQNPKRESDSPLSFRLDVDKYLNSEDIIN